MRLFEFSNLPKEQALLIITWLISVWMPGIQKTLLELVGGRRSGKSWAQDLIKQLVDPSSENLTYDIPTTVSDTQHLARLNQVISLDQVESLNDKVQKYLPRLLQGTTIKCLKQRARDDVHLRVSCPVILNGLTSVVTLTELAESTLTVELPEILQPTLIQMPPMELNVIRTALLSILGDVHAELDTLSVSIENRIPSAIHHFCRIGCLVARSLGYEVEVFLDQLNANRQYRHDMELARDPTALSIHKYVMDSEGDSIEIPVGQLLSELKVYKPDWVSENDLPQNPQSMGAALLSLKPLMQTHGIQIDKNPKIGGIHKVKLTKIPQQLKAFKEPESFSRFTSDISAV
ncbi:hypothetical protein GCM10011352_04880 [Marinobacterium zhoushanense]|uniref:Uncharacterized protein n=2 Tax=Marinobacterium zhoushanense TaxID=1679163 RepID=A0ABQ1K2I1_9GAMM|nr:hypothetical protein GCM10011352_04880 [Marinobacterium zhoushanense]